tara:strand:- start:1154 stop:1315 length:162 start_codon:yes stop_codon:yes gene_type:complete
MKDAMMYFLDNGGYELGYDENQMPDLSDLDYIVSHNIKIWEYKGVSEQEYYGG